MTGIPVSLLQDVRLRDAPREPRHALFRMDVCAPSAQSFDFIRRLDRPIHTYDDAGGPRLPRLGLGDAGRGTTVESTLEGRRLVTRRLRPSIPYLVLVLTAVACGGGPADVGSGGPDADAQRNFTIASPDDGGTVESPLTLNFTSREPLGPPESGAFHVHVFFDGNEDEYEVVTTSTFEAKGLSPGEHVIAASLRNADHSAAGVDDEITVTVVGGSRRTKGSGGNDGQDGSVYDY